MSLIHFDINIDQAKDHIIEVTARLSNPKRKQLFSLPAWIPGSYLIREFSKEIGELSAKQNGRKKKIVQLNKNSWSIECDEDSELILSYFIFARDASVRTAWLDLERCFFNGSSIFLCAEGFENQTHSITIHKPNFNAKWKLATALNSIKTDNKGFGLYDAQNYDELIDCPVEIGDFWSGQFVAAGVTHEIVVAGAPMTFDGSRLIKDVQKICEYQIKFWHGNQKPVIHNYLFILWAVGDGYGGLEHKNSTALIANRSDLPRLHQTKVSEGYIQLLGLFSHEYFHTWNIKRLKPQEFKSLNLNQENYTELLWFFEGFTSYYDDLVLVRCGLIEVADYLKLLTKTLNQVLQTPGRKVHTVAQASFEAWTKYYRPQPNTANTTVSYYTKGALIALCLDLTLRQITRSDLRPKKRGKKSDLPESQGTFNLDDVMRELWLRCKDGLMSESTLLTVLFELTGINFKKNLQNWVHSTVELPVNELLDYFGVKTQYEPAQWAQKFGLRTAESSNSNLVIKQVLNGSIAQKAGLCEGDEWIGIEIISKKIDASQRFWRINKLDDIHLYAGDHRFINALISRDKKIFFLKMDLKDLANIKTLRLIGTESILLDNWLTQPC